MSLGLVVVVVLNTGDNGSRSVANLSLCLKTQSISFTGFSNVMLFKSLLLTLS